MRLPKICLRHDWEAFYFTLEALRIYNLSFNRSKVAHWDHSYGRDDYPEQLLPPMNLVKEKNQICLKCGKIELHGDNGLLTLCERASKARLLLMESGL